MISFLMIRLFLIFNGPLSDGHNALIYMEDEHGLALSSYGAEYRTPLRAVRSIYIDLDIFPPSNLARFIVIDI
jgi:hypothetical protein